MSKDLTAQVNEALRRTPIMALSTVGDDGSWTTPVQYTHDSQLHLSFMSLSGAKHVLDIQADPRVSVAITPLEEWVFDSRVLRERQHVDLAHLDLDEHT